MRKFWGNHPSNGNLKIRLKTSEMLELLICMYSPFCSLPYNHLHMAGLHVDKNTFGNVPIYSPYFPSLLFSFSFQQSFCSCNCCLDGSSF